MLRSCPSLHSGVHPIGMRTFNATSNHSYASEKLYTPARHTKVLFAPSIFGVVRLRRYVLKDHMELSHFSRRISLGRRSLISV